MSFIIKALKKLEEENSTRQETPVRINSAILAPDLHSASPSRSPFRWIIILLVFVAGGGITWFFTHKTATPVAGLRGNASRPAATPTAPASLPPAVTAAPAVPPAAPQAPAVSAVPAAPVAPHAPPAQAAPAPARVIADEMPRSQERPVVGRNPRQERGRKAFPAEGSPPAASSSASTHLVDPPSSIQVNGIAYQDDPAASSAVVNGLFVKQGMSVNGARVERIFSNRVRFSGNGGNFEVYFSK